VVKLLLGNRLLGCQIAVGHGRTHQRLQPLELGVELGLAVDQGASAVKVTSRTLAGG
jgi:hypothetical protein